MQDFPNAPHIFLLCAILNKLLHFYITSFRYVDLSVLIYGLAFFNG